MPARKKPRISINKLGEYSVANANRRKQIIKDAKNPDAFKVTRYKDARDVIPDYLRLGRARAIITRTIGIIRAKSPGTDFTNSDRKLSIKILEIIDNEDLSIFDGFDVRNPPENILVDYAGVDVSINPEIILYKEIKGKVHVGCVKLILSKTNTPTEDTMKTIAAANHKYLEEQIIGNGQLANPKMCFVYNVYKGIIVCSPNTYVTRIRGLESCCQEILAMWPA